MNSFESVFGNTFIGQSGPVDASHFAGKKLILLYFSAHWCPPCRGFTPELAEWYEDYAKEGAVEIIFASRDKDEKQFQDYFGEMPWVAFPLNDARVQKFKDLLGVTGIPFLAVMRPDGTVVTKDGRGDVSNKGGQCISLWK